MSTLSISRALRIMVEANHKTGELALIARETTAKFFSFFIWARLAFVPFIVAMAGWIGLFDHNLWRQVLLGAVVVGLTTISIWDVALYHFKGKIGPLAIPRNVMGAGLATLVLVAATGGLESPIIPVIIVVALTTTIFISPRLGRFIVLGLQLPVIWATTVIAVYELVPGFVPDVFGGGRRVCPDDTLLWTQAVLFSVALLLIISFGARIRRTFEAMLGRIVEERDKQLEIYEDQARTLTTLSGEIAHELKNPLASVKGLAALVDRGLTGKPAERMSVLRGEVERMQSILEEFLNFSRPLVPLTLEQVSLGEITGEVVDLHEGVARERGVALEVRLAGDDRVLGDPRKIKQVLINLLQNALDASPKGGAVTLEVGAAKGGAVTLRVKDEGPGVDEALGERVFEAGVTGKATGSGLGLTMARALARQHGGELTLETAEAGGAVATLRLPVSPPLDESRSSAEPSDKEAAR